MTDLNRCFLMGRIISDVDVKYDTNKRITYFIIGVEFDTKNRQTYQTHINTFKVFYYGRVKKELKKDIKILIDGQFSKYSKEKPISGIENLKYENVIRANEIYIVDKIGGCNEK